MTRSIRRLPPMQRVVEVEFLASDFNPPSFFHRYAREIVVADLELREDIERDEVVMSPMVGKVRYIYPTEPTRLIEAVSSNARLWQLACLLEREIRQVRDPVLNPLSIPKTGITYFPLHFRHRTPHLSLRPKRTSVPCLVEVRKETKHIRLFRRRLAEVTAEPGTLIMEGV